MYLNAPELCDGQSNACAATIPSDETDYDIDGYVECSIDGGGWDGDTSVIGGNDCDDFSAIEFPGQDLVCRFGQRHLWKSKCRSGVLSAALPIPLWTTQIVMTLTIRCIQEPQSCAMVNSTPVVTRCCLVRWMPMEMVMRSVHWTGGWDGLGNGHGW